MSKDKYKIQRKSKNKSQNGNLVIHYIRMCSSNKIQKKSPNNRASLTKKDVLLVIWILTVAKTKIL